MSKFQWLGILLLQALITGCVQHKEIYSWGHYQDLVYKMYSQPGSIDPIEQIDKLTTDLNRAQNEGKKTPPGIHAHLGYMYYLQGNLPAAKRQFNTEKQLYPESEVFNERLLKNIN